MRKNRIRITALFIILYGMACQPVATDNTGETIMLPKHSTRGDTSLEAAIAARRSIRSFTAQTLTPAETGQLLWAAQGITEPQRRLRAAPSAGATYPLVTYLVNSEGIYRYLPERHALQQVKTGDLRADLAAIALGQSMIAEAPATVIFTAIAQRTTGRYGKRGEMYIHMEAGHAAQNLHLQAVALKLGSVPVGAFDPQRLARLIGTGDDEEPLYMIPVGHPK